MPLNFRLFFTLRKQIFFSSGADVLSQLANLKEQLHSERQRVENALEHEKVKLNVKSINYYLSFILLFINKTKPEIYDPRTYQRIPHQSNKREVDIFDLSRQKPVSVRPREDYSNLNSK